MDKYTVAQQEMYTPIADYDNQTGQPPSVQSQLHFCTGNYMLKCGLSLFSSAFCLTTFVLATHSIFIMF